MESITRAPFPNSDQPLKKMSLFLYEHPSMPNHVIREVGGYSFNQNRQDALANTHKALVEGKKLFTDLEDTYGVKHAGFMPVVGESDKHDKTSGYIVSRKINGFAYKRPKVSNELEDRDVVAEILPEHKPAAEALLTKLSKYYVDKGNSGEAFLDDIFSIEQYIYTEPTVEQPDGEFVLVDLDPPEMGDEDSNISPVYAGRNLNNLAGSILEPTDFASWQQDIQEQLQNPIAA